ncbi:MAG: hypothetical protein K6G28_04615 [Acholeplasmatales bacterium]|nr:hypothetical protein [Acholeplasmatales bacterium]
MKLYEFLFSISKNSVYDYLIEIPDIKLKFIFNPHLDHSYIDNVFKKYCISKELNILSFSIDNDTYKNRPIYHLLIEDYSVCGLKFL